MSEITLSISAGSQGQVCDLGNGKFVTLKAADVTGTKENVQYEVVILKTNDPDLAKEAKAEHSLDFSNINDDFAGNNVWPAIKLVP